ncbi:hypothetical protein ACA910_020420 [Epithemia clementina (nom. ined.)]
MARDMVAVVAAAVQNRGIGFQGQLPWKIIGDMKHFKRVTTTPPTPGMVNAVVMGRTTWESLPRPLPNRTNVVLTQRSDYIVPTGVLKASSLKDAADQLAKLPNLGQVFCIGGGHVYREAISQGFVNRIIYTEVSNLPKDQKFDTYFPELLADEWECQPFADSDADSKENDRPVQEDSSNTQNDGPMMTILEYNRKILTFPNLEEIQYLNLCRDIMETGIQRGDRTGTGTLSKFGAQMRFDLRQGRLPLLTTKRTFWRGVAEELLWFISGSTNANELMEKDIHIWDGNGSREFLDSLGLSHREQGDLGPVYGFQWRHFGAEYVDMHTDYTGQGVDQLAECIRKIKETPEDRRIVMSAWNPADLGKMALPPCHMFCQFYVDTVNNELSCQMYQRSADMGLGVPFNIASYALLTHLVAHVTGRRPGDFVHVIGDAHIYLNHVDALKEQLRRTPRPFPTLKINPEKRDIDDFCLEDLTVLGYQPHKTIKMQMAV